MNRFHEIISRLWVSLIVSIVSLLKAVSLGTLLFSGTLSGYAQIGIGLLVVSHIIIRTLTAFSSSFPTMVSNPQPQQIALLAVVAASIESQMRGTYSSEQIFLTVMGAYFISTVLVGTFNLILGIMDVGKLIKYIPYPVINGFIAGTGWLLIIGAYSTLTGLSIEFSNLQGFFQRDILLTWLPGTGFAVLLYFLDRQKSNPLLFPSSAIFAFALFFLTLNLFSISTEEAIAKGWLIGNIQSGQFQSMFPLVYINQLELSYVFNQSASIGILMLLTALTVLFSTSALEVATNKDIDVNSELKITGYSSLLAGFFGGVPGSPSLATTLLLRKMGVRDRWVSVIPVVLFIGFLYFSSSFTIYLPRPVLGGILLYLGLDLFVSSILKDYRTLPRSDFTVILLVVFAICFFGFIPAVGFGLLVTTILFTVKYSKVKVARHTISGGAYQSRVLRPGHQRKFLRDAGNCIFILELHGFIFFGTANQIIASVDSRLKDNSLRKLEYLLLDFRFVTGFDSSATLTFMKLNNMAEAHGFTIGLSHLKFEMVSMFERAKVFRDNHPICKSFHDLDRAFEWCEDEILKSTTKWRRSRFTPMPLILQKMLPIPDRVPAFMSYLKKFNLEEDEVLFERDEIADALYFLESGQISVFSDLPEVKGSWVRTLKPGTMLGETSFILKVPHSTMAIAERNSVVFRLTHESYSEMKQNDPYTASCFNELVLKYISEQLVHANSEITTLRK